MGIKAGGPDLNFNGLKWAGIGSREVNQLSRKGLQSRFRGKGEDAQGPFSEGARNLKLAPNTRPDGERMKVAMPPDTRGREHAEPTSGPRAEVGGMGQPELGAGNPKQKGAGYIPKPPRSRLACRHGISWSDEARSPSV